MSALRPDHVRAIVRESIQQFVGESIINLNELKDREACRRAAKALIATGCMGAGVSLDVFGSDTRHAIAELVEGLETLHGRLRMTWEVTTKPERR